MIEEANINPLLLKKIIQSCDGDIRNTIMQLQFWFQSKKYTEGVLQSPFVACLHAFSCSNLNLMCALIALILRPIVFVLALAFRT